MGDLPGFRSLQGETRIDMNEQDHVARWTKEFGVDEQKLWAAISVAGSSVEAVKRHFNRRPDEGTGAGGG